MSMVKATRHQNYTITQSNVIVSTHIKNATLDLKVAKTDELHMKNKDQKKSGYLFYTPKNKEFITQGYSDPKPPGDIQLIGHIKTTRDPSSHEWSLEIASFLP